MAVLSDVIRADEKGAKHRDAHIIVTEEIHELAMNLLYLRMMQLQYRTFAKDLHEQHLAEQNKHDIQDELEYSHEKHTAAQRMIHKKMMSFRRSAALDKSRVSQDWKDYLPGYAAVVDDMEQAASLIEVSLVVAYRAADFRVRHLAFLFEAYEPRCWYWESLECLRRLALTGMLLFFQDGSEMQIVIGAVISIVSLILFGAIQPFLDDKADKLATFAQLMTFLTLYAAIIVTTGCVQPAVDDAVITVVMVFFNMSIVIYDVVEQVLDGGEDLSELEVPSCNLPGCASSLGSKIGGAVSDIGNDAGDAVPASGERHADDVRPRMGRGGSLLDTITETMQISGEDSDAVLSQLIQMYESETAETTSGAGGLRSYR